MLSAILHTVDFASIELAVSGKQSVPSGGVFPGEILPGVVSLCFISHLQDRAVLCLFSPSSSHWETSFPILCTLSLRDGSFLPEGTQNPQILLLPLEVTLPRVSAAPAVDCAVTAERTEPVI